MKEKKIKMNLISSVIKLIVVTGIVIGVYYISKKVSDAYDKSKKSIDDTIKSVGDGLVDLFPDLNGANDREELIQNQKRYLKQTFSILEIMNQKLDKIFNQLYELNDNLQLLRLETKFDSFFKTLVALQSQIAQFRNTIESYSSNNTILSIEVKKFVDNYKNSNYEAQLIAFLEVKVATSEPPIDVFINVVKKKGATQFFELKSSLNKFIFNFYVDLMVIVNTGGTLIISYYELQNKITNGKFYIQHEGDIKFLNKTMSDNQENMLKSFRSAMLKVNQTTDLKSFMDLQRTDYELRYPSFLKCYIGKIEAPQGL